MLHFDGTNSVQFRKKLNPQMQNILQLQQSVTVLDMRVFPALPD